MKEKPKTALEHAEKINEYLKEVSDNPKNCKEPVEKLTAYMKDILKNDELEYHDRINLTNHCLLYVSSLLRSEHCTKEEEKANEFNEMSTEEMLESIKDIKPLEPTEIFENFAPFIKELYAITGECSPLFQEITQQYSFGCIGHVLKREHLKYEHEEKFPKPF